MASLRESVAPGILNEDKVNSCGAMEEYPGLKHNSNKYWCLASRAGKAVSGPNFKGPTKIPFNFNAQTKPHLFREVDRPLHTPY